MISVNVKSDLKRVAKKLDRIQRKQIPQAAKVALNRTAFDVRDKEINTVDRHIDRPTPFTRKGFLVRQATKKNLHARVFIPPNRWKYMRYAVEGGTRIGNLNVPVNAKLNKYGSMRRNYLRTLLNRRDTFSATIRGVSGVWQRNKSGAVKLIAAYESSAHYQERFPFHEIGEREVRRVFTDHLAKSLRHALATAR